jgi:hypothetical protein
LAVDEDFQRPKEFGRNVRTAEIFLQVLDCDFGVVGGLLRGASCIGGGQGRIGGTEGVKLDAIGLALLGDGLKGAYCVRTRVGPENVDVGWACSMSPAT